MSLDPDSVRLKRACDEPSDDDGTRVLVERLRPRGVSSPAILRAVLPDRETST